MKGIRSLGVGVLLAIPFGLLATPTANAANTAVTGNCSATASFVTGTNARGPFTVDTATIGNETIKVRRSDTVEWKGGVPAPPGKYSGYVKIDLPPLVPDVTVETWKGDGQTTENSGTETYDLPSIVPAGVTFQVIGRHADTNGVCSGVVDVEIEGGPFDSPLTAVSLAGTLVTAAGFAGAVRPLFRRVRS
jgi:hypothetical protein